MNSKKYNIAVLGATGAVGETVLKLLLERNFPIKQLYLLASQQSVGNIIVFGDQKIAVQAADEFDFTQADFCFSAVEANVIAKLAPKITAANCWLIDKSSQFRRDPNVPLIVPEVNAEVLRTTHSKIISVPNCSTIPIVVALKPIYDAVGLTRMNVATYQSVSGAGKPGIQALEQQELGCFSKPIAFNVIPHIDDFCDNGYTKEEMKVVWETQKILQDETIQINVTAVRVPVFYGHSAAVHIETREKITKAEALKLFAENPAIKLSVENDYPTAVTHAAGTDPIYVGRVREDISHPRGLDFWVVADNIRKGAALNAIQIAEWLIRQ